MDALQEPDRYEIYAPPRADLADPTFALHRPLFFPVGLTKLAVLSVCTLGLYVIYWFYKSWRQAPRRSGRSGERRSGGDLSPALHRLLPVQRDWSVQRRARRVSAVQRRGSGFLLFRDRCGGLAARLATAWLASWLSFHFCLSLNASIGSMFQSRPLADRNERFSPANIVGAAIGGVVLLAAVVEMIWGQAS